MLKNKSTLGIATILLAIILFPLPPTAVNILYAMLFVLCIATLFISIFNKEHFEYLPKNILYLSVFILVLCINLTRIILTVDSFEKQNIILRFVSFNYILEIITAVCVIIGVNIFSRRNKRLNEVNANLDGATKFLSGTVKAISFLYFFTLFSGIAISLKAHSMPLRKAFSLYAELSFSNLILFLIPTLILEIAVVITIKRDGSGWRPTI